MTSYTFIVNGDYCPVCGISAFDHIHPDDTKPKEFKMLTPAKERGEKPETWEEWFDKEFSMVLYSGDGGSSKDIKSFIAKEIQSAVEAERRRIRDQSVGNF